ncbi:MAG: pilus assembly protein N-terminal domain-containing protein [Terracidiphilus sp.]
MRSTTGITIAYCGALIMALCTGQVVRAQAQPQPAPTTSPAAGDRFGDSTNELNVEVGKAVLVDCAQPIKQVAVGTGDVAEATAISPTEIMITGKGPGMTSLIIWDIHGGRQFFNVTVRPNVGLTGDSLDAIRRELKTELPGQAIRVSYSNNSVFLRGTVSDLNSSARAVEIASTAGKVVNLMDVNVPTADPQILLKVRFVSVDRSKALTLGVNLFDLGMGNALGGVSTGHISPPTISGAGSGSSSSSGGLTGTTGQASFSQEGNIFAYFPGLNVGADIHAMEEKGVAEVLAEPNLLATNGKEASFLAGGSFPYPVVSGTSGGTAAVSIEFKDYGIRLNFIPTITPRGTIRLQVAPEVSALDYANEVQISGFEVPGITERRVNTEVELKDGQTFIIGGLLDKSITDTFQKIPFLGDIPILGKLFQSEIKTKNDTELIVLVTPEVVSPLPAGVPTPNLKFPDPNFIPPNSNIPMHEPDEKTADNTLPPAPATVPVETLIQSMKPEKPLVVESGSGGFGTAGAPINGGGGSGSTGTSTGTTPP